MHSKSILKYIGWLALINPLVVVKTDGTTCSISYDGNICSVADGSSCKSYFIKEKDATKSNI